MWLIPECVGDAVGLQGVESFKVEVHVEQTSAGWISVDYGEHVLSDSFSNVKVLF